MVGSASLKVLLGSRQAPPWMKLYFWAVLCKSFGFVLGKTPVLGPGCMFIEELTHTSQYLIVPGAGAVTFSAGNSQTATFCRTLSLP